MTAGTLRERVTCQRLARTQRNDGGYDTGWTDVFTVSAAVKPVRATEQEQAGRLRGTATYLVTMRPRSDFTADDRLLWGSTPLNIREIRAPAKRALSMDVIAESGVVD